MPLERDLDDLGSLADPLRRALYRFAAEAGRTVSREEAGRAVGVSRSLAAYHLDRLVDDGLLEASFAREPGRGGPGAGRPAKRYARSSREVQVTLPARDYQLAAELLARAVEHGRGGARAAVLDGATAMGQELGAAARRGRAKTSTSALRAVLDERGYEPYDDRGDLRLRNCPFHALAAEHRELVCGMNLALLEGVCEGLRLQGRCPVLDPRPGECCVAFVRQR